MTSGSDGAAMDDVMGDANLGERLRGGMTRARVVGEQTRERFDRVANVARVRAADGLEEAAERLQRLAVREAEQDGVRARTAEGASRLAGGLDSVAVFLRNGDEADLRGAVERQIGSHPGRTLVAVFAVGFLFGRMLR